MHGVRAYTSQSPHPLPSAVTMTGFSKKPSPPRDDSFELEVFDAERYFSGAMDNIFADASMKANTTEQQETHSSTKKEITNKPAIKDNKRENKWKKQQPGSPAGVRLPSFLNSLFFHQATSAKKQKPFNATIDIDDDYKETRSLTGRRWRISSSSSNRSKSIRSCDLQSLYSCRNSGFSTPGFNDSSTPSTAQKEKNRYCFSKQNKEPKAETSSRQSEVNTFNGRCDQRPYGVEFGGRDGYVGNKSILNKTSGWYLKKDWILIEEFMERDKKNINCKREEEVGDGDGWESDSSSDLFELNNYDLGGVSSGLPVYGSTKMESFKGRTTIARFAS